ncbi:hypothetical protein G9A89_010255 [Geosiphon pyriformis]|nr:hypothetical protein G9A89_010255 [Geosiphon pyriformis]
MREETNSAPKEPIEIGNKAIEKSKPGQNQLVLGVQNSLDVKNKNKNTGLTKSEPQELDLKKLDTKLTIDDLIVDGLDKETYYKDLNADQENHEISKLPRKEMALVLLGFCGALFIACLDVTIVATCLAKIASEFEALDQISWVATAYILTATAIQPLSGKLSDIFGRKALLLFGVITFVVGSALCGAAQNIVMLIIFRAVAGLGSGGIISMVMVIISDLVEPHERGKYQSMTGVIFALASITGPLAGGVFSDHLSWWAFYINLPVGIPTIFLIAFFLKLPAVQGSIKEKLRRIDYLGCLLTILMFICLLLPTNWGGVQYKWSNWREIFLYILGGILVLVLVFVETKVAEPVIPPHLFKYRSVVAIFLTNFFVGNVFFSMIFYTPLYFQAVKHDTATQAGLQLIPFIVSLMLFSIVSGVGVSKTGLTRPFCWIGCAILTIGCGLLKTLDAYSNRGQQISYLLITGTGMGLVFQVPILVAQSAVSHKDLAVATAVTNSMRAVGGIFGTAIDGSVLKNVLNNRLQDLHVVASGKFDLEKALNDINYVWTITDQNLRQKLIDCYVDGIQSLYTVAIPFAGAAFLASLLIKHQELKKKY